MLLFNLICLSCLLTLCYFNTSNVTIQPDSRKIISLKKKNFNTSNVTIQRASIYQLHHIYSYFNTSNVTIQHRSNSTDSTADCISIHLMLLFNEQAYINFTIFIHISIHLMLLFNKGYSLGFQSISYISIHLMLLFNLITATLTTCVRNFNTSNVTIQHSSVHIFALHMGISIHLMLLFNNATYITVTGSN